MSLMDRMERRFKPFCIPNLTLIIMFAQILGFVAIMSNPKYQEKMILQGDLVLKGEAWRLVSFICRPATDHVLFFFFACYLFKLVGTALEREWGTFRYNIFMLIGYIATVSMCFIFPHATLTNVFIGGSVFLAFAMIHPDFSLMLMLILPVKVRWLALLQWIFMGIAMIQGDWPMRCVILAGVLNFFIFFGAEIVRRMKRGQTQMATASKVAKTKDEPFHTCSVCGVTDKSHPTTDFRYCSQCDANQCYCEDHIRDHEHTSA